MTLDHITFRTANLAATKVFFETLFDLVDKPRPQAIRHIPGHWLYAEDEPVVHLIGSHGHGGGSFRATGDIDHVGLRIEDYKDFRARLDAMGITYSPMELPELDERRLFFHAPGGTLIEAVYRDTAVAEVAT